MARNNTVIILLLLCVCSSSLSSGWPSLMSSLASAGISMASDKKESKPASGEGKVCIGNRTDRDYQSGCKKKSRFAEYKLGLQGSCNPGDTMIAYDGSNCTQGNRRAYCKRGSVSDGTWSYVENDDCSRPDGVTTECTVKLYEHPDFKGDYIELDRSINAFESPFDFNNKASSIIVGDKCKSVVLHSDYMHGGVRKDAMSASPEEQADFRLESFDYDNKASSIRLTDA